MDKYTETLEYIYNKLQAFHRVGATAYKPGLHTTERLSAAFGNPHLAVPFIHVAGTNGKGSTAHTLSAILQAQGYKTGLYTSPHLLDFNERIRVNGKPISHEDVMDFCERFRGIQQADATLDPSFFELATVMAFEHFMKEKVDVAVIEVGLGGRLDATNIITPVLSIITNITLEHTQLLGDTRAQIAEEKGGIIKDGVPVVVGEMDEEIRPVFESIAAERHSLLVDAASECLFNSVVVAGKFQGYETLDWGHIDSYLSGSEQISNTNTILHALRVLNASTPFKVTSRAVSDGFMNVCSKTGLRGRWEKLSERPTVICDTGHNPGAWKYVGERISGIITGKGKKVHMVIGFVGDKDVLQIARYLPHKAEYYIVTPSTPRAALSRDVAAQLAELGLASRTYDSVEAGWLDAKKAAGTEDIIFVGGSNFVVADFLSFYDGQMEKSDSADSMK